MKIKKLVLTSALLLIAPLAACDIVITTGDRSSSNEEAKKKYYYATSVYGMNITYSNDFKTITIIGAGNDIITCYLNDEYKVIESTHVFDDLYINDRSTFEYDENGNLIVENEYENESLHRKTVYSYENNVLKTESIYRDDEGFDNPSTQYVYEYEENIERKKTYYSSDSGLYLDQTAECRTVNKDNNSYTVEYYVKYDSEGSDFEFHYSDTYDTKTNNLLKTIYSDGEYELHEYNEDGNMTYKGFGDIVDDKYVCDYQCVIAYDENGYLDYEELYNLNDQDELEMYGKYVYLTDENGVVYQQDVYEVNEEGELVSGGSLNFSYVEFDEYLDDLIMPLFAIYPDTYNDNV